MKNLTNQIIEGDCLKVMRDIPDNYIDLIVTDPPYGIGFMGKDWDKALPDKAVWRECLRVLKDGAFAFVMCIPRQDCLSRMIINLEGAGFNIGFSPIYWAYASGFPKAQNIGKTVDKRLGVKREVVGIKAGERYKHNFQKGNNPFVGLQKDETKEVADDIKNLTEPATSQAKALNGSYAGFQPKPAVEVIIVAMKPLSEKTYVEQALKNRKGITWLDDCRIPTNENTSVTIKHTGTYSLDGEGSNFRYSEGVKTTGGHNQGRFPANLLCSDDVLNKNGYNQKTSNPNWRGGHYTACLFCGKQFWVRPSLLKRGQGKFCSNKCRSNYHSEWMRSENNPKWNGGSSGEYKKGKTDKRWREKRQAVYRRDNFTCQACGDKSGKLHAHHKIPWRLSQDDGLDNLISLCPSCHTKIEAVWATVNNADYIPSAESSFSRYFDLDAWFDKPKTFPFLIVPKASKSEKNRGMGYNPMDNTDRYNGKFPNSKADKIITNKHPTVKPLKLMSYLIMLGSREGDIVLDPFIGTGTTAIASKLLNRKYMGIEISKDYCKIARNRLKIIPNSLLMGI